MGRERAKAGQDAMKEGDNISDEQAREERRLYALDLILDAWEAALAEGVNADLLASTAIFAALTDMVENHGEEVTAQMAEGLAARVRDGEFTLVDVDDTGES